MGCYPEPDEGFLFIMVEGWIKLHRKIIDSGYFTDSYAVHLWVYLLINATYDKRKTIFNGKILELREGQLVTGRKKISQDTGIPEQIIRKWLNLFEINQQITIEKTNTGSCISILNYKLYQSFNQPSGDNLTNNQPTTNQQPTNGQPLYKKDNKDNNVENDNNIYNDTKIKFFNLSIEDEIWKESLMKATKLNYDNVDSWIIAFSDHVNSTSENFQIISQWRKYCTNWIKSEIEKKSKSPQIQTIGRSLRKA